MNSSLAVTQTPLKSYLRNTFERINMADTSITDAVTNLTSTSTTASAGSNSVLDKDAFLQLLLVEMQNQDPTDPMDTDKMLTQTAQLSSLEMQQNTNETMEKMVETMEILASAMTSSTNMSVINAIGKMATITDTTFALENSTQTITARMYLPAETKDGATFQVLDSKGNVVRSIKVEKDKLTQGVNIIGWDGRNDNGVYAGAGNYTMKTSYTNADGGTSTSQYGSYLVESVKMVDGEAKLVIGGKEVSFSEISQFS